MENKIDVNFIKANYPIVDIARSLGLRPEKSTEACNKYFDPNHDRDSASLTLYPQSNSWFCFGACGKGGSNIDLVMYIANLEFLEACEYITGQRTPKPLKTAPVAPQVIPNHKVTHRELNQWYDNLVFLPEAQSGRDFLMRRGIFQEPDFSLSAGLAKVGWRNDAWNPQLNGYDEVIAIPYIDYPTDILGVRYRSIKYGNYWSEKGSKMAGHYWNNRAFSVHPDKPLWWFESELDGLLVNELLERSTAIAKIHKHAKLKPRRRYIYVMDNDDAGRNFAQTIRSCYPMNTRIEMYTCPQDFKDIGDYYQADPQGAIAWIKALDNG